MATRHKRVQEIAKQFPVSIHHEADEFPARYRARIPRCFALGDSDLDAEPVKGIN